MSTAEQATKRVLVVDDNDHLREVICELLELAGFAVDSAPDGSVALERLDKEEFDLMLLDVWMPEMNGLELLGRLRARPAHPKVIMLTADDAPDTVLRAVRDQAYQYLAKPFDPKILVDMVRSALAAPAAPRPIEVVSARANWVELLVPCELEVPDRVQSFLLTLKADLPAEIRESVGRAFRELLLNAIEWGGHLDPEQKVRIAYLRTDRMLLYRIADPGPGFRLEGLAHAAIAHPADQPIAHLEARERAGLRPGGFGLLLAQQMVDTLLFNEKQNEVVLIKYLSKE
jgi:CheY-like chemotaxis protein/anti-sigma regulatory factor (Ser/Thr protein kinase)